MSKPIILVTNDDGIRAKGLRALVEMVQPYGEVIVIAPEEGHSGQSHAITTKIPIRLREVADYAPGVKAYACTGTPVDCVKIALSHVLSDKPQLVVSGINHGSNSSVSTLYSGTMAAAQEGALYGVPSIGYSLLSYDPEADFSGCIAVGRKVLEQVLQHGLGYQVCLNVNIPNLPANEIKGYQLCRLAKGAWVEKGVQRHDPFGGTYYWFEAYYVNHEPEAQDTDEWYLSQGYAAVVPLKTDLTCEVELARWKDRGGK